MQSLSIDPRPAWGIAADVVRRPEGVCFSRSGALMAVAEAGAERVSVYARDGGEGAYLQVGVIAGPRSGIGYPHDVDFSPDERLLAVANREAASLTIYAREPGDPVRFGDRPVCALQGHRSRLRFTDAVAFVPPEGRFLAAVNLGKDTVTFYRRSRLRPSRFGPRPCFVLGGTRARLVKPDGLAFTPDGALLAVTNHGADTVTVYARRGRGPRYGPEPAAAIGGSPSRLRCPHSVAFSPDGTHLAISNAGGRAVTVYRRGPDADRPGTAWSESPALEVEACDAAAFAVTNPDEPQEGGSKGIAFGDGCFAVCNSDFGLRVHRATTCTA